MKRRILGDFVEGVYKDGIERLISLAFILNPGVRIEKLKYGLIYKNRGVRLEKLRVDRLYGESLQDV